MKRNLVLGLLLAPCALCGCSSGETTIQTKGIVDCYSIRVTSGTSTVFYAEYSAGYAEVHEYKSSKGDSIYTDSPDYQTSSVIRLYNNRYTNDYIEYSYVGFVGYLTIEKNYYLDLDNKLVDSEVKYSEYLYSENPVADKKADNKKAYDCAEKNYFIKSSFSGVNDPDTEEYVCILRTDLVEKSLMRHSYMKLGEDSVIDYKAKWF